MQTPHQVLKTMIDLDCYTRGGYMCNDLVYNDKIRIHVGHESREAAKQSITDYMIGMSGSMVNFYGLENLLVVAGVKSLDEVRSDDYTSGLDVACILNDYNLLLDNDFRDSGFTMWTVVAFCIDFDITTGDYKVNEENKKCFDDFIADVIYANWDARPMSVQAMRDAFYAYKESQQ